MPRVIKLGHSEEVSSLSIVCVFCGGSRFVRGRGEIRGVEVHHETPSEGSLFVSRKYDDSMILSHKNWVHPRVLFFSRYSEGILMIQSLAVLCKRDLFGMVS